MWTRREFLAAGGGSVLAGSLFPLSTSWATESDVAETLRVVFYTDVHARTEWETPDAMARCARLINEQAADLVLAGGDLITDGFQNGPSVAAPRWDAYMETLHSAVRPPVEAMIGNHDLVAARPEDGSAPSDNPRAEFLARLKLDRTYRRIDAGGYRIFLLDSIEVSDDDLKYHGRVNQEQIDWLKGELATTNADTPLIVMTHLPLMTGFFMRTKGGTEAAPANRIVVNNLDVLDLFARHNLVLVLQGHLHVNEMLRWNSTTFITGGSVCAKYWRGPWFGTEEGFGVLTLRKGRVEWDYIDIGWDARRPANV